MFTLPSLWNLIISTLVFFIAARYLHRFLEGQGLPKGMTRGTLVFALASLVSWGSGEMVDWTQEKIEGPQPAAQTPGDLSQLLKRVGQAQLAAAESREPGSN
jgi:fido (protein-threonine AMPylation protein)